LGVGRERTRELAEAEGECSLEGGVFLVVDSGLKTWEVDFSGLSSWAVKVTGFREGVGK
jgi:hypothetical protein